MQAVLDEVIEKIEQFSDEDRDKLIWILQEQKRKAKRNGKRGFVHPNTVWINEHYNEYAGKYVALKDGELIAFGETIKEADLKAKEKGVKNPLLTYLPREDEEIFCGGWL